MDIQRIPIADLHAAKYNPRRDLKPGDPEYDKLAASMEAFGYIDTIVWNKRTGNVISGHQRLKILLARGDKEVEVSVVDFDPVTEKAANLALNKIAGSWDPLKLADVLKDLTDLDFDMDLTGFDLGEIGTLLKAQEIPGSEKEYDESCADDVKKVTCPKCGHEFPV